jgi:peptide/nickel transport system substrate-binding protein
MTGSPDSGARATRRRVLLGSAALGAAGLSGCLRRVRSVLDSNPPEQVSLEVTTLPGDADAVATQIGRQLTENLSAAGVESDLMLLPRDELRREVLINQEYDIFVAAFPGARDPDFLRSLLHSSFANEPGWQNPFNFTDFDVDDLLAEQRREHGPIRKNAVVDIQYEIARQQPFTVLSVPDEIRAVRTDRFTGWGNAPPGSPLNFVGLEDNDTEADRLWTAVTSAAATRNLNPIDLESRNRGAIMGLLYDSLGRWYDGDVRPWAAQDWTFEEDEQTVATVTLNPELTWHDGSTLTTEDIAFTIRFLRDTGLGEFDTTVPAPRFRGRTSLIEDVEVLDDRLIRMQFGETDPTVAKRAFTVPIFPRSKWVDKARSAEIAGVSTSNQVTEALVWENPSPVGSGVFTFESRAEDEQLVLSRYDEHFLNRSPPSHVPERFVGGPPYEELSFRVVRSDETAVQLLETNEVDAVVSPLGPEVVPRIGRTNNVDLRVDGSRMFYLVGFNTNQEPLGNPHFRRFVARLLDKEFLVDEILDGYGTAAASPLAGTDWVPSGLQWEGADPEVPFFGSDGNLDVEAARNSLRKAGFEFTDEGELLKQ